MEDGSIACKAPPPVDCAPDEQCLPPDCAVSSDGLTYCPDKPLSCPEQSPDGGCSSPGSCGDAGCDPACPQGVSPEECAKILEQGNGSNASGGGVATPE
jgi:hypothetical protein